MYVMFDKRFLSLLDKSRWAFAFVLAFNWHRGLLFSARPKALKIPAQTTVKVMARGGPTLPIRPALVRRRRGLFC